jgi:hypothetical protein
MHQIVKEIAYQDSCRSSEVKQFSFHRARSRPSKLRSMGKDMIESSLLHLAQNGASKLVGGRVAAHVACSDLAVIRLAKNRFKGEIVLTHRQ